LVLIVTLLARGTVADVDEQLGEEVVTLLAPVEGQLGPHGVGDAGQGALRRRERRQTLVHHALLLVMIHKA
jgi:hypothetical protein